MYNTTGGGALLPYTMVTGGGWAAAVAIGMTTEFNNNIDSIYYGVHHYVQELPARQRQLLQVRFN